VVDATVGLGGHAALLAEASGATGRLIGLDVDPANIEIAGKRLAGSAARVDLIRGNFSGLPAVLASLGLDKVDVLFADLGVSSTQLDQAQRGFSFQRDGPLDMRIDPDRPVTAAAIINRLKERDLAEVIWRYAQEPASRRIAKRICEERRNGRITTTLHLARVVCDALGVSPGQHRGRTHPATRTFLALRIAVNEEISNLESLLEAAPSLLRPGGRFGIISFHSLEDKPIKLDFRKRKTENIYQLATTKPIVASEQERAANPRSRSAKLRVAIRLP
jgi:16S rRNA (cytosine1402-N4)-methyltransferase